MLNQFKRIFQKSDEYVPPRPAGVKMWTNKDNVTVRVPKVGNMKIAKAGTAGIGGLKHPKGKDIMFSVSDPEHGLLLAGWVDKNDLTYTAP